MGGAWIPGDPRVRTPDLRAEALCLQHTPPRRFRQTFPGMVRVVVRLICTYYRFRTAGATPDWLGPFPGSKLTPSASWCRAYIHMAPLRYLLSPSMRTVLRGYAAVFCSRKAVLLCR